MIQKRWKSEIEIGTIEKCEIHVSLFWVTAQMRVLILQNMIFQYIWSEKFLKR
jgi:hypothetical protein